MGQQNEESGRSEIIDYLKDLDKRITRIEQNLRLGSANQNYSETDKKVNAVVNNEEPNIFELNFGEYWFANIGVLILALGVISILTLPFENFPPVLPSLLGFSLMGVVFFLSHYWRNSNIFLSKYLTAAGMGLAYFSTLRLFHFSEVNVLSGTTLEAVLLLLIVAGCLGLAVRRNSKYLLGFGLTIICLTGLIINNSLLLFFLITVSALMFVYFKAKNNYSFFVIYGIVVCYFTHFVWAINNPVIGNEMHFVSDPAFNLIFILIYTIIFSVSNYLNKPRFEENEFMITTAIVNALGSYVLFTMLIFAQFNEQLVFYQLVLGVVYLFIAVGSWLIHHSKFTTFIYSILGYLSLSIAIIKVAVIPDVYIYLIWQSLVVIATAIWFRSKFIVVFNFLIYLLIFTAFLASSNEFGVISLSFGIVALISARVMNWQKHRLTIQTELMRNTYLAVAFISIPYTILKAVPSEVVPVSWLAVVAAYYTLSIFLHNYKYRWMAHLTLLGTIIYIFAFALPSLSAGYLILNLLAAGAVLITVSLIYTRLRSHASHNEDPNLHLRSH